MIRDELHRRTGHTSSIVVGRRLGASLVSFVAYAVASA
jgi:hypothetical protein